MEREACVCDHGFERSDLCAEIMIIIIQAFNMVSIHCKPAMFIQFPLNRPIGFGLHIWTICEKHQI